MRRVKLAVGLVLLAIAWWMLRDPETEVVATGEDPAAPAGGSADAKHAATAKLRTGRRASTRIEIRPDGMVSISGTVMEPDGSPVGNVEVVFRNPGGEETVTAAADGTYRIDVEPGAYRAFVRDDSVLSFGPPKTARLPTLPEADDVGLPDESAMPLVVANVDLEGIDLRVVRGGVVRGRVIDGHGRPIARAVVRAVGQKRPVLGTDLVETNAAGEYEMRLPAGFWRFDAGHPRFAGVDATDGVVYVDVHAGDRTEGQDIKLAAGCVISGRVVGADGKPTGEGAIEQGPETFAVVGRISETGTFRFVTRFAMDVTLRAWPWKSPSAPPQTFACKEGTRFDNVVFQVPGRGPDIEGTLADASGEPMTLAYIDLRPLDPGGIAQQERTDLDGKFAVYQMPAGRYQVTAHVPGRGVLSTIVTSPQSNVRLALGATGHISGTADGVTDGSFELRLAWCDVGGTNVAITEDVRIASVRGGKFELDGVPSCKLAVTTQHEGRLVRGMVDVPANGDGKLVLVLSHKPVVVDLDEPSPRPPAPRPDDLIDPPPSDDGVPDGPDDDDAPEST